MVTTIMENSVLDQSVNLGVLKFEKKELLANLNLASYIVTKKCSLPTLRHIKIVGSKALNRIEILAADIEGTELTVFCTENISKVENFYMLVECSKLIEILKKIDNREYELQIFDNSIKILGDNCNFSLNKSRSNEFPIFENFNSKNSDYSFMLDSKTILNSLEKTVFCTCDEPTRYQMNGILFKAENNVLNITATDTKRLALSKIEGNFNDCSFILSPKIANFLVKFLYEGVNVNFELFGDRILITSKKFEIYCKMVNGIFPDFQKAIPVCENSIFVNKEKLIKALNNILPFTSDITNSIKFSLADSKIVLNSSLPESGQANFELGVLKTDFSIECNFNPKFMIEGLKVIDSELVEIEMKDNKRPFILKCQKSNYIYLLIPVLAR